MKKREYHWESTYSEVSYFLHNLSSVLLERNDVKFRHQTFEIKLKIDGRIFRVMDSKKL